MPSPRLLIQTTTGNKYVWDAELASKPNMKEYIGETDEKGCQTYMATLPKIDSNVVSFHLSADGLGDTICGIYAACGLANAGHEVEYYAKNLIWLYGVSHPKLKLLSTDAQPFDANANYKQQLRSAFHNVVNSRSGWYIQNISNAYGIPVCKPSRPNVVKPPRVMDGKYVVIAPFATHESRDWGYNHYRKLSIALKNHGIRVIPIGTKKQSARLDTAFYGLDLEKISDKQPEWITALVANATVVVGNDSGIVHLGGLYQVPTICILSHFSPQYLFMCGETIDGITPDMNCVKCHTLVDGGWDQNCNFECSALQTINPEFVANMVIKKYENA